jgi:hypothetical protein
LDPIYKEIAPFQTAIVMVNNGPHAINMTCDEKCFGQLNMTASTYQLQDLYNLVPIPGTISSGPGGFTLTAEVPGGGGSAFLHLAPCS